MRKLRFWLDRSTTILASALMAGFMIVMVYNVFSRYALGKGVVWYMESAQFMNVWAMFIAGIGISAANDHLRVTVLEEMIRGKPKTVFRILVGLLTITFYCFVAYSCYLLAMRSRQTISTMEPLKMAYVYWLLPFAAGLSALAVVVDLVHYLLGHENAKEADGDHVYVD